MDKDNLHHAYLLEGEKEKILPEIFKLLQAIGVETVGNPDYLEITLDSFKIEDAKNLRAIYQNRSVGGGQKVFVLAVSQILPEAQNVLLKIFEEPVAETHFFLIVPDSDIVLPTLASRLERVFYRQAPALAEAEEFVSMKIPERIEFLKDLLAEEEEENPTVESPRTRALRFLNSLEKVLHERLLVAPQSEISFFNQIFTVRDYLRQPGSSAKTLMESLALVIPQFKL